MNPPHVSKFLSKSVAKSGMGIMLCVLFAPLLAADGETAPRRDSKQPVDEAYTAARK